MNTPFINLGSVNVIDGPCAVNVGRGYWIGIASGNNYARKRRRTADAAIKDAQRLEPRARNKTVALLVAGKMEVGK